MNIKPALENEFANALAHTHAARLHTEVGEFVAATQDLIYAQSALACARELLDEQRYQQAAAERTP